ncbi:MAG: HNH endonuclease [Pseudomonadota bacterium]
MPSKWEKLDRIMPPKGRKMPESAKIRISQSLSGRKMYQMTDEIRDKIRRANIGKKRIFKNLEETKKRMSIAQRKIWDKKGRNPQNRSKHVTHEYVLWRMEIFNRDNFTCMSCERVGGILNAHHIKEWINFPELRYEITNGITLCEECHKKLHKIEGKKKRQKGKELV